MTTAKKRKRAKRRIIGPEDLTEEEIQRVYRFFDTWKECELNRMAREREARRNDHAHVG